MELSSCVNLLEGSDSSVIILAQPMKTLHLCYYKKNNILTENIRLTEYTKESLHYLEKWREISFQNFFIKLCMSLKEKSREQGKDMKVSQEDLHMKKAPILHFMGVSIQPHNHIYNDLP